MSPVILIVLDGYGVAKKGPGNAIALAKKPYIDYLRQHYPTVIIKSSGNAVGLPKGYMGNSEVGHFTIGAGRIVNQSLETINESIRKGHFFHNHALESAVNHAKRHASTLHLLGLISDKGVHAHINHLIALLELAKRHGLHKVYIHAITDGRDVAEKSAEKFLKKIIRATKKLKIGDIATIIGRFYALDRDKNWRRTQKSYELLVHGKGYSESDTISAINNAYQRGDSTDYYIHPIILNKEALIQPNDSIIFFNFRTDRAAQLTRAFTEKNFTEFPVKKNLPVHFVCMGPYSKDAPIAFPTPRVRNNLGSIIARHGLKQLRIAETEKYAHVTFFFNSQIKTPYRNEERLLIHSAKVASYAEKPKMRALEITHNLISKLKNRHTTYELIILNYANGDLVGHSGELKPTIKGIEVLDQCLKQVIPIALEKGYQIILTSDHGNAEQMLFPDGSKCPSHTTNPVECTFISATNKFELKKTGGLQDIAPTILHLLKIPKPKEMTGKSLIKD